jgi:CHRD domain-containing protein
MKMWQKCLAMVPAIVLASGASASDHKEGEHGRRLKADLKGLNEVPAVSSVARGSFRAVINDDETEIAFQLNYSGLEAPVTQSHIHFGQPFISGGISVWLCGNPPLVPPAGTPGCPDPGDGPEVTGTIMAANVIGPAGQGIAVGEFAELIRAIRKGDAYANVHSTKFPGGEIRGQIQVD